MGYLKKMEKKITIKEFNKKYFAEWKEISKVIPIFEEWSDEDGENKETHICQIDIEFKNGEKISLIPYSNKDKTSLDDEDFPICCALDIFEFEKKKVNWKVEELKKEVRNSSQA